MSSFDLSGFRVAKTANYNGLGVLLRVVKCQSIPMSAYLRHAKKCTQIEPTDGRECVCDDVHMVGTFVIIEIVHKAKLAH